MKKYWLKYSISIHALARTSITEFSNDLHYLKSPEVVGCLDEWGESVIWDECFLIHSYDVTITPSDPGDRPEISQKRHFKPSKVKLNRKLTTLLMVVLYMYYRLSVKLLKETLLKFSLVNKYSTFCMPSSLKVQIRKL